MEDQKEENEKAEKLANKATFIFFAIVAGSLILIFSTRQGHSEKRIPNEKVAAGVAWIENFLKDGVAPNWRHLRTRASGNSITVYMMVDDRDAERLFLEMPRERQRALIRQACPARASAVAGGLDTHQDLTIDLSGPTSFINTADCWSPHTPYQPSPEELAPKALDSEQALAAYGKRIEAELGASTITFEDAVKTTEMPSYMVRFTAHNSDLLTKPGAEADQTVYLQNLRKTEQWMQAFCTEELRKIIRSRGIFLVTGQILDSGGQAHPMAACQK